MLRTRHALPEDQPHAKLRHGTICSHALHWSDVGGSMLVLPLFAWQLRLQPARLSIWSSPAQTWRAYMADVSRTLHAT